MSERASGRIVAVACVVAVWFLVFAAANIVVMASGRLEDGSDAAYAPGLRVESWVVLALKLVGAGIAVLSVVPRSPVPTRLLATALWAAATTLAVYAVGNLVETVGFLTGLTGHTSLKIVDYAYVAFFLPAAYGCGVLAVSFSRRHHLRRRTAVVGMLGAPVVLGALLLGIPELMVALGLMPDY